MDANPDEQLIYSSGAPTSTPPDLRFLHYNDVYHVDASSAEPVGGLSRFQTLVNYYRGDDKFKGQPEVLTFFSGDAFNPSLESSVTKGSYTSQLESTPIGRERAGAIEEWSLGTWEILNSGF
jgi:hypothetical protein